MTTKRRILYTATSDVHIKTFHIPYLKWLKSEGFEVHLAIEKRGEVDLAFCDYIYYIPFKRNPFHPQNLKAYRQLRKIIHDHHFQLIHCHTPAVSVLTRLAAITARRKGTVVLYTAHGFHFFKGAPLKLWLLYYPVEKLLSIVTDVIITINKEDYDLITRNFSNQRSYQIKGIGVNTAKFRTVTSAEKLQLRLKHGYREEEFILLYVAEFIDRKNQSFVITALPELRKVVPDVKVILVGKGPMLETVKQLVKSNHSEANVSFLGWRDDVEELAALADIGISSSKQEGLGLGLAEEMLCSIPIVATSDRGHREMIVHGENGFMFPQGDVKDFVNCIAVLYNDAGMRKSFGEKASIKAQEFAIERSLKTMAEIYREAMTLSKV